MYICVITNKNIFDMKNLLYVIAGLFLITFFPVHAQKIKKHEIDKFTKEEFIQTSSSKIVNKTGLMRPHKFECYIERHGNTITMPASMQFDRESVAIDANSGVMLLLDNDETVRLFTAFTGEPNRFNEFSTCFNLTEEDINKLLNHKVVSIRMIYVGGHYDADVNEKNQQAISNMISLVIPKD